MDSFTSHKPKILKESLVEGDNPSIAQKSGLGNVVANHYNSLEEHGLEVRNLSRIVFMRNFNNWIKSFLINKCISFVKENFPDDHRITALDLGCGKGGDLLKWQKGNIKHLICADIATTSLQQCHERYLLLRGRPFSAEFIAADCTKTKLKKHLSNPSLLVDIVSCQFAFHYCFESHSQAETMVRNISENLKKGGYFVATIPDSNKIVSFIESSPKKHYANEVFKIEFPENRPEDPSLFGDTYNFYLEGSVDCPEFLVHRPTLVRLCKKYGLELVFEKAFSDVYTEGISDRDSLSLLFRMRALELYNPSNGSHSSSNKNEYLHAEEELKRSNLQEIKTLSQSEWEAICLYVAVIFKKIK